MLPSETFRALLFVGIIAAIYIVAAREVVKIFLRRRGYLKSSESHRQLWYRRITFTLAAIGIACFAYGYFIEPYWPQVTRVHISTSKLPSLARPIRIAHISDLHSDPKPRLESRLFDLIAAEKPDIIVFTGDAINSPDGLPVFKECLRRIAAIAPTFVVRGNWDTTFWRGIDLFSDTGAEELRSSAKKIEIEGSSLWIGGVATGRENDIADIFKEAPADAFKVFLCHYPDEIEEASRLKFDLYCAGHTHGGQIALPFYGAIITLSRYGKKYESGLYRVEDTWLYVNRGIGMEGGPAPRVRFCARPEITIIEVASLESGAESRNIGLQTSDSRLRTAMKTITLVLKNGAILDGTLRAPFYADVVISHDLIVTVDGPGGYSGIEEIDCKGLFIAPGFIDTHSHSDLRVLAEPMLPMKLRQGITLEVFGQDGISVAPVRARDRMQMSSQLAGLLGRLDREWDWQSTGEYLEAISRARPSLDCAYLIPHGAARLLAMGMEDRRATEKETVAMQGHIRQAMREGALGMSTGLIYPPCCYSDTAELIELGRAVAEFDGVFVSHMRSESDYLEDAVEEMIEVARHAGVRTHISHFKVAGRENWPVIDRVFDLIDEARADGLRITADQYPYIAGSTMLGAILPPWAHAGGVEETLTRLRSADERGRMKEMMLAKERSSWDSFWKWSGPEGIVISDIPSGRGQEYVGKNLSEAARINLDAERVSEEDAAEFALDLLAQERMGVGMISFSQSEDVVQKIMKQPYVNVCTDGLLGGKPHPRAYGTYPRMLGRYSRELGALRIEEAVHKMSGLAAETFNLKRHGRIAGGARANLVVFDPERVIDRATFEDSRQYPEGIEYVIVGGEIEYDGGRKIQRGMSRGIAVRRDQT